MWLKTFAIIAVILALIGGVIYGVTASTEVSEWGIENLYSKDSKKGPGRLMRIGSYCQLVTNYDEAIRVYQLLVENHPDHGRAAEAQFMIGTCHRKGGSALAAKIELQKVVDTWPSSPFAERAREMIKKIDLIL